MVSSLGYNFFYVSSLSLCFFFSTSIFFYPFFKCLFLLLFICLCLYFLDFFNFFNFFLALFHFPSNLTMNWQHNFEKVFLFLSLFPHQSFVQHVCVRKREEKTVWNFMLGKIKSEHKINVFPSLKWNLSHKVGRIDLYFASTTIKIMNG